MAGEVLVLLVAAVLSQDCCGQGELVDSEKQKLARTPAFAYHWSGCVLDYHETRAPEPLPFPAAVVVDAMQGALQDHGVPLVLDPVKASGVRPLNFTVCLWKDEDGYAYDVNLAPAPWRTDPRVDVEQVGVWFWQTGRASPSTLQRALMRNIESIAARFAKEWRAARASKRGGRTRG